MSSGAARRRLRPAGVGLLLGLLSDQVFADPQRAHPVAGYGALASALERSMWRDSRRAGAAYTGLAVAGPVTLGVLGHLLTRRRPAARTTVVAMATWAVVGGTSLTREAESMHRLIVGEHLVDGRVRIRALVGRDPASLDLAGLTRASVESVAENTSDAVVAPLLWGAVAGLPGLLGYRAVNTLDAMVGHRSARYARFGFAAARLDDVANWVPARLTALLTVLAAPLVGGSPGAAYAAWRRDAPSHPSPNAGVCEASAAGALGVRLGGETAYAERMEQRPVMGRGRPPQPEDLLRAVRLSRAVGLLAAVVVTVAPAAAGLRRPAGVRPAGHAQHSALGNGVRWAGSRRAARRCGRS